MFTIITVNCQSLQSQHIITTWRFRFLISGAKIETLSNFKSFWVEMLLQYLNNVSKIDLYTSSPTARKIACLLFATTCLAVVLPSLAVSTRWKPGRGQSLPQILLYESNHTSALRRVEKLHQRVRKHSITYPYIGHDLIAAEPCKKVISCYKIQQGGELPLCQRWDVWTMRVFRCEKNLFTPSQPCHRKYQCLYSLGRKGALLHVSKV